MGPGRAGADVGRRHRLVGPVLGPVTGPGVQPVRGAAQLAPAAPPAVLAPVSAEDVASAGAVSSHATSTGVAESVRDTFLSRQPLRAILSAETSNDRGAASKATRAAR